MSTFGILFLLGGALLLRQVVVGRAQETPSDIRDLALAFLNADTKGMKEVLSARGTNVAVGTVSEVAGTVPTATPSDFSSDRGGKYAAEMVKLGNAASGYRLGATGPTYYDCSGLNWRAARNIGVYKGGRFTTSTFRSIASSWCAQVETPEVGDIVLWEGDHSGVYVGNDTLYSARSVSKGIGQSSISGDSSYFGRSPTYWRIK